MFFEGLLSRSIMLGAITLLPDNIKIGTCQKQVPISVTLSCACIFGVRGVRTAESRFCASKKSSNFKALRRILVHAALGEDRLISVKK